MNNYPDETSFSIFDENKIIDTDKKSTGVVISEIPNATQMITNSNNKDLTVSGDRDEIEYNNCLPDRIKLIRYRLGKNI
jgi:hypothetical protein